MEYDLTKWSTEQLVDLLSKSGYDSDDILSVEYKFTTLNGVVVFDISYEDIESGEIDRGRVYVSLRDGRLVAEY